MDIVVRAARGDGVVVTTYCPSRPYLEVQIPENVAKVSRFVIRLTSRDQGFCDDEGRIGQPGFTWFELNVETPSGRNNVPRKCIYQNKAGVPDWQTSVIDSKDDSETYRTLLDEIRPLDIVQLFPRAQFVGWMNFVHNAEIEIHCVTSLPLPEAAAQLRPHYEELGWEGKKIRVLELFPDCENEAICVRFVVVDLLDPRDVRFEALSYCWGQWNSGDSAQVQCLKEDGSTNTVHVSPSLYVALLHLRGSTAVRMLWVDQLCINQTDKAELARQVSIMGHIYSGAERVVVWLGGGDADVERSVDTVNKLISQYLEPSEEELKEGTVVVRLPGVSVDNLPQEEVNRVLSLPWFWRVWVIQEVWLGRERIFMYGHRTLEWDTIRKANAWSKYGSFEVPGQQHTNLPLIWASFAEITQLPTPHNSESRKTSLEDDLLPLIIQGMDLKASDPRDHVYGFLGLFEGNHPESQTIDRLIYPDYHKSVSDVFVDFTIWWILRNKSLGIFSAIQVIKGRTWQTLTCTDSATVPPHDQPASDHPSWAMWYSGKQKWTTESLGRAAGYRVTGDTEPDISLIAWEGLKRKHLKLQGYQLSRIQSVEPYHLKPGSSLEMLQTYNRVFDVSGQRRVYNTPVTEAFNGYKKGWDDPLQHWVAHRHGQYLPAALPCLDKCLFRIEDDVEGLCPAGTKPGDVVAVLYGGPVPYILREMDAKGSYTFIGECYVEAKMKENLLTPFEEAGTARKEFVLI
ncbi:hypothetical protein EKO04_007792 [Ascochyta lentis]|uniref:Heterokaryon incompatibility domain-containing protein n=1 Tax=Ascochyta lentis TaxID=205686 RepID=A0A8H7J276_9PLEO|nr:hypothetical protein EKO04_007792 [Ascochyta lentis]